MPWVILVLAGLCEVAWAVGLKRYGLTATWGGAATVALMLLSFLLLGRAMRQIPLGTAYGVWTGIGAVAPPPTACGASASPPTGGGSSASR